MLESGSNPCRGLGVAVCWQVANGLNPGGHAVLADVQQVGGARSVNVGLLDPARVERLEVGGRSRRPLPSVPRLL